ncbi:MAG: hypothetical protein NT010_13855 [Proteobacteria bacterium]|nr:hypothetical protein [Pseudomonadota bacterium]
MQEHLRNKIIENTVIFYSKKTGKKEIELQKTVANTVKDQKIEICKTVEDLFTKLRFIKRDRMILILLVSDEDDFRDILTIKSLLDDMRILLILPNAGDEIVAMGHSIHPRFLSYIDGNFQEVAAVLEKIEKLRV